jgi:hypothetical protein
MQAPPWFLGTCALASFAGAVSGATINTSPIQRASIGSDQITRPAIAFDPRDTGHDQVALPDHYAMQTPQGLVPVAALSTRGIYSQRRYGWDEASYSPPPEPTYFPPASYGDDEAAQSQADVAAAPAAPVQAVESADQGNPKVIDVAAALASR